jgi:AcrR family transcriptional regulator
LKRRRIRDAAVAILSRDGVAGLTMERLAAEVGIAKGTLYLHFPDKRRLLDAVVESSVQPLMDQLHAVLALDFSPGARLAAFSTAYLDYFTQHRKLFRVLLYERRVTEAKAARFQTPRFRKLVDEIAAVIEAGIRAGEFRPLPARDLAVIFLEFHFALTSQRLAGDLPASAAEDAALLSGLFLNGVLRPSGTRAARQKVRR